MNLKILLEINMEIRMGSRLDGHSCAFMQNSHIFHIKFNVFRNDASVIVFKCSPKILCTY
jgi:hypothetical protein